MACFVSFALLMRVIAELLRRPGGLHQAPITPKASRLAWHAFVKRLIVRREVPLSA